MTPGVRAAVTIAACAASVATACTSIAAYGDAKHSVTVTVCGHTYTDSGGTMTIREGATCRDTKVTGAALQP